MFDIATMKTVYQMQPCVTNDTNLKEVLQLLFLFFFFFQNQVFSFESCSVTARNGITKKEKID